MKTDFYKYKNNKIYSTCIECFNQKVESELCNKKFNKTYSSKHIERCLTNRCLIEKICLIDNKNFTNINTAKLASHGEGPGGALRASRDENNIINNNDENHNANENQNDIDENNDENNNRTLTVGPSFCGETHLLLSKLHSIRLCDSEEQIHIITRSPEQYSKAGFAYTITNTELCTSVEEDLEDITIQSFQNCCVVFDDMLDSNQNLIDPISTRGRHNDLDVYCLTPSYFDSPKRTIRNNSKFIILFQQTLKNVEHIYRDIAGFDMSYDEFKNLCRGA